jgi:hypothetical protein
LDIVEAAKKITESRDNVRGSIKDRTDKYILSGLIIKTERFNLVLERVIQNNLYKKEKLTNDDKDTMIDLTAYLIEFSRRIE